MDHENISIRQLDRDHLKGDAMCIGSKVGDEILVLDRLRRVERTQAMLDDEPGTISRNARAER